MPGGVHPAGWHPHSGPAIQRVPVALRDRRPLWPPRQRQRQGQRRGSGRLGAAQLHGAAAAVCVMGRFQLEEQCRKRQAAILRGHSETIGQRLERDLQAMAELPPAPFEACEQATGQVSSQSLVRYQTNDYSVPVAYGHRDVWVRGYVDQVVIGCGGGGIARHPRGKTGEEMFSAPVHSLPLIEQKIGALDQAAPLAQWDLPAEFHTLRRVMEARMIKAGRREYVQVLRLLESFGLEDLHVAVKTALRIGAVGFDAIKHLVLCRVEKRLPKFDLEVYPYLPRATVAKTSPASYLCLVSGDAT